MELISAKKQVTAFLIFTAILSTVTYILYFTSVLTGGFIYLMWCPGIAALITRLIYQKNLKNFGWGWGKTKYQALSYGLPLVLGLIVYGIVWLTGLGGTSIDNFTGFVASFLGLTESLSFLPSFFVLASVGLFFSIINAFGEEIGWRGLLVPELAKFTSFTNVSLISGAVWAIWHIPGILFVGYSSGLSPFFTIPCFVVMVISASFVFAWIRLKSGSVWTAVILHATHNLFIQAFYDQMTVDTGSTYYFTTEFGIGMAVIYTIAAYYFWRKRGELSS
ncbi:CPBP family intramembrane glutamic endopeptidase [Bacteroidota bacterium]